MGTISSGIGLVSGIDTGSIVDQLLALEARPKQLVEQRNVVLTTQQIAYQDLNARLLNLKLASGALTDDDLFESTAANSSNESVATVTSSTGTVPGTYEFSISQLVSTQQVITGGFADQDQTAVAPSGGTLTFEFGPASLDSNTSLSRLNGSEGVQRGSIRITDRSGASAVVDLSRALNVDDVLEAINSTTGIGVEATVSGDGFVLTDATGATVTDLSVTDIGAGTTAADLGLNIAAVGDTLTGSQVNAVGRDTLLDLLNDGNGVRALQSQDDFQITRQDGTTFNVNVGTATDLGGVIDAINTADAGGGVTASINAAGTGLLLDDASVGGSTLAVTALNSSNAAADLGILGSDGDADGQIIGGRLIASLDSKLLKNLNGGSGVGLGEISITNRAGGNTNVDLATAGSVQDVIDLINASGAQVTASLNEQGNGLQLTDNTGSTANDLTIADVTGTAAADLNLAGAVSADTVDSGNLQLRYLSESTRLSSLNGGRGVTEGRFIITDSAGDSATIDLTQGDEERLSNVISEIQAHALQVNVRINDNGDGLIIEDTGPGTFAIKVEESGSTTAKDLGILGEAANPGDDLDGSFERTVTIEATDTLDDVAAAINSAGIGVSATIINDGSLGNPFRLSLISGESGKAGSFVFDDGGLGFDATTLVEAQNSVVFYGSSNPADAIAITSATNTLNTVIPGATIDLLQTSDDPVRITITQDNSAITDAVSSFVDGFNTVVDTINTLDSFDAETEQRGLLLGDPTVARVRSSLYRFVNSRSSELTSQFTTLSQVGIRVGSGAKLTFDSTKFLSALESDPEAVNALFTFRETETDEDTGEITTTAAGLGVRIDELLDGLTDPIDGLLQNRVSALDSLIELGNERIEFLDDQLLAKRARLEAEFLAMELAIGQLQNQSSALSSFQPVSFAPPTTA